MKIPMKMSVAKTTEVKTWRIRGLGAKSCDPPLPSGCQSTAPGVASSPPMHCSFCWWSGSQWGAWPAGQGGVGINRGE